MNLRNGSGFPRHGNTEEISIGDLVCLLFGQLQRTLIRSTCLCFSCQSPAKLRAAPVREAVCQITFRQQLVHQPGPLRIAIPHRHRHRPVQLDRGRGIDLPQQIVQATISVQSVAALLDASACTAAIAACKLYAPTGRSVSAGTSPLTILLPLRTVCLLRRQGDFWQRTMLNRPAASGQSES